MGHRPVLIGLVVLSGALGCASCGPETDLGKLTRLLKASDPSDRAKAAWCLGKLGPRAAPAVPALVDLLADDKESVALRWGSFNNRFLWWLSRYTTTPSESACKALEKIGAPAVLPLIRALNHKEVSVQRTVIYTLGRLEDPRACTPLVKLLDDPEMEVRNSAAWALGSFCGATTVPPLIDALRDESAEVRCGAAVSLGKLKDRRAEKPLLAALKDKNKDVRRWAANSLTAIADPASLEGLMAALSSESESDVKVELLNGLRILNDRRGVALIINALGDKDEYVRMCAERELGRLSDESFGRKIEAWRQWNAKRRIPEPLSP